jgi:hypothetical protein
LTDANVDVVEGNPADVERSPGPVLETEYPVPPQQTGTGLEAPVPEAGPTEAQDASSDFVPTPVLEGEIIASPPEEPSATDTGESEQKASPKEPVLEGEDMDFEGLGMVLGEDEEDK